MFCLHIISVISTQCYPRNTQCSSRFILLTKRYNNYVARRVNPGRGRPQKNWAQCLIDDIRVFEATEGFTDSSTLLFGVETVLWPRAAKEEWKLAPGDRRIASWRDGTGARRRRAGNASQHKAPRAATKENGGRGGGTAILIQL